MMQILKAFWGRTVYHVVVLNDLEIIRQLQKAPSSSKQINDSDLPVQSDQIIYKGAKVGDKGIVDPRSMQPTNFHVVQAASLFERFPLK